MSICSCNIPLEIYHGVPKGWSKDEVLAAHVLLNGQYKMDIPEATEPGAPNWLPDRYHWLQYRATLHAVSNGIRAGDAACAELGVRYIELDYIGSYSGFIKERLARALKGAELTEAQINRLKCHFQLLVDKGQCLQEYGEYKKLLKLISN